MLAPLQRVVNRHQRRVLLARRWWSPGAISWGTDLSGLAPTILNNNADVVAGAAAWSTAIRSQSGGANVPLIQRTNNDFYPLVMGVLAIVVGIAAPTALTISYAIVSGTPIATFAVNPTALIVSTTVLVPFFLHGALAQAAFQGAGVTPLVEVFPTTNGVTVAALGSSAIFQLQLGVE
jgi:hypothetical protein